MFADLTPPTLPPMEVLLPCGLVAVLVFMLLAACFGPFLSAACDSAAAAGGRGFYAKLARQTAQMTLLLILFAAAVFAGGVTLLVREDPAVLAPPFRAPLLLTASFAALGVLFSTLHAFPPPQKRPSGPLRVWLGLMAGLFSLLTLYCGIGLARRLLHAPPAVDAALAPHLQLLAFFHIPRDSFFWPLFAESIPLGLAASGACATLWLLLMRTRQDLGRDYYAFALPACATWATGGTALAIPAGVFVFLQSRKIMLPELSHNPSPLLGMLGIALPVLACILWLTILRSKVPMRGKVGILLAFVLLLGGFAAQVLILNKVIPSP
jgi:hypothetical protein